MVQPPPEVDAGGVAIAKPHVGNLCEVGNVGFLSMQPLRGWRVTVSLRLRGGVRRAGGLSVGNLAHDAAAGAFEEGDDVLNLGAVGHLVFNLVDDVEYARLAVEEQAVGVGDVLLHLLADAELLHHRVVGAAVFEGPLSGHDVGRDVA